MGFFKKAWNGVKKAAKAVGRADSRQPEEFAAPLAAER